MIDQRLLDMLVDRETGDLERNERIALAAMDSETLQDLEDEVGLAVAAAMLAHDEEEEKLPAELHIHIAEDAKVFFAQETLAPKQTPAENAVVTPFPSQKTEEKNGTGSLVNMLGWLVAAALAAFVMLPREPDAAQIEAIRANALADLRPSLEAELRAKLEAENTPPSLAEQRRQLLAQQETAPLPWQATEDEAAVGAAGDVVWSDAEQKGFMRIQGLAANDPGTFQYQLWIFDEKGDERFPVDGGVFDIPAGSDEVVIPIDAKIGVTNPQLYAITVEKPGGVVVSGRERIVLVAKPG